VDGRLLPRPTALSLGGRVRTIAVINRKGGSGKTTTAVNTAAALAGLGHPALLIDVDPQGSASDWLDREGNDRGLREAFTVTGDLARLAVPTDTAGLDIVPSTQWLVSAEKNMLGDLSVGISRALQRIPPRWDFVIVDCPPSLSYLAIGVMMGVRELVIPVEAHSMAFTGAVEVMDELPAVRKLNPNLASILLLPCRVTRTRHARGVVEALEADFPAEVTTARIRESITLAEAADEQQPISAYAPNGIGATDYREFAQELLNRAPPPVQTKSSWWKSPVSSLSGR
jgi:chromosome partitioning protein